MEKEGATPPLPIILFNSFMLINGLAHSRLGKKTINIPNTVENYGTTRCEYNEEAYLTLFLRDAFRVYVHGCGTSLRSI